MQIGKAAQQPTEEEYQMTKPNKRPTVGLARLSYDLIEERGAKFNSLS
jgi:hypothetical protein